MFWNQWLAASWADLHRGSRVSVPTWLPHPRWSGFETPPLAEPAGQTADWVRSLSDGSRLHIHEFADGRMVAHRDPTDPKRGPLHAVWHWATESTSGRLAVLALSALAVVKLVGTAPQRP